MAGAMLPPAHAQYTQLPGKLLGSNPNSNTEEQGYYTAISYDGSTAIISSPYDSNTLGCAWIFVKSNGAWVQQGQKLVGSGSIGANVAQSSVAISADGNTAVIGGHGDNSHVGAVWVFTRSGSTWSQQAKLTPTGFSTNGLGPDMGIGLAISSDGNTIFAGGSNDNNYKGAVWIFTRSGNTWTQLGNKIVPSDPAPGQHGSQFGQTIAISNDGNTAVVGGNIDNNDLGATWIFVKSNGNWVQQGPKLFGTGGQGTTVEQGTAVAISADGNTVAVGASYDNNSLGATWIFTRSNGNWSQQGGKLVGSGFAGGSAQGGSEALSADGNTLITGGELDNNGIGAFWVFKRSNGSWTQQGSKYFPAGLTGAANIYSGQIAMSGDGSTIIDGVQGDNNNAGGAFVYTGSPVAPTPSPVSVTPPNGSGTGTSLTFTFSDTGGAQALNLVNVLIRDVLDGRHACYVAFVPASASSGSLYLVDDAGDAGGPYSGMLLPGGTNVNNSQCTITGAGSSYTTNGNNATLTLAISFTASFTGNKVVYLAAQDAGSNSGWAPLGVWNIPGLPPLGPSVTSINLPRATGFTQSYTFTFNDTNGWQDLSVVNILINNAINGVSACYLAVVPSGPNTATVYLVDNAGDAGGPFSGMLLPGVGSVQNSQCTVNGTGSSSAGSVNSLQVSLNVQFYNSFTGNQIVYAAARSNTASSGWQAMGTVSVK
jgi:hypothetical protein